MTQSVIGRKELRVACSFEAPGATPLNGHTRDLSSQAATIQSPLLAIPTVRKPRLGDTGVLSLAFRLPGTPRETLKIQARVAHVSGMLVALNLNVGLLTPAQRETLLRLLDSHA